MHFWNTQLGSCCIKCAFYSAYSRKNYERVFFSARSTFFTFECGIIYSTRFVLNQNLRVAWSRKYCNRNRNKPSLLPPGDEKSSCYWARMWTTHDLYCDFSFNIHYIMVFYPTIYFYPFQYHRSSINHQSMILSDKLSSITLPLFNNNNFFIKTIKNLINATSNDIPQPQRTINSPINYYIF